jgi:hypothetical protein
MEHKMHCNRSIFKNWGFLMPIHQLAPPTITDVVRELTSYEEQYGISTEKFLEADGRFPEIDEDDAVEWLYRAEQLRVLRDFENLRPYSSLERGMSLENDECSQDLLAA